MYDANGGETARVEDVSGNQAINSHVGDYSVPQEAAPNAPIILEDAAAFVPPHSAEFDQATTQHGPIVEHNVRSSPAPCASQSSQSDEEGSESDEELIPPGPIDPDRCTTSGQGFSGGAAGAPVSLTLLAKDSSGRRIRDGGAHILVMIEKKGLGSDDEEPIEATVIDHGDGRYTATFSVPDKGSYELSIEVNGTPIGGSPFPVYFSAVGSASLSLSVAGNEKTGQAGVVLPPAAATAAAAAAAATMPISAFPNLSSTQISFSLASNNRF